MILAFIPALSLTFSRFVLGPSRLPSGAADLAVCCFHIFPPSCGLWTIRLGLFSRPHSELPCSLTAYLRSLRSRALNLQPQLAICNPKCPAGMLSDLDEARP